MKKIPLVQTPASRSTDPDPSHLAEAEINATGTRRSHQLLVLFTLRHNPETTSRELALFGSMDRYTPSRRLPELETAGLVERAGQRTCRVGKRQATTWRITDKGTEVLHGGR